MLETFVPVPSLDVPVPQPVGQLVKVLRLIDTVVPEQVIDVPKITSQDLIPQRAVLRVPQMAEQLVDKPVPSFDDFELVEEDEEEEDKEEEPPLVPQVQFLDRMLDFPVVLQLQVQKTVKVPQLPFLCLVRQWIHILRQIEGGFWKNSSFFCVSG